MSDDALPTFGSRFCHLLAICSQTVAYWRAHIWPKCGIFSRDYFKLRLLEYCTTSNCSRAQTNFILVLPLFHPSLTLLLPHSHFRFSELSYVEVFCSVNTDWIDPGARIQPQITYVSSRFSSLSPHFHLRLTKSTQIKMWSGWFL